MKLLKLFEVSVAGTNERAAVDRTWLVLAENIDVACSLIPNKSHVLQVKCNDKGVGAGESRVIGFRGRRVSEAAALDDEHPCAGPHPTD